MKLLGGTAMDTLTTSEARARLSQLLAVFRQQGEAAEPVVFGDHRRAEGVLIPYATYARLATLVEQARFDAAPELAARAREVIEDPSKAVTVVRQRARQRG